MKDQETPLPPASLMVYIGLALLAVWAIAGRLQTLQGDAPSVKIEFVQLVGGICSILCFVIAAGVRFAPETTRWILKELSFPEPPPDSQAKTRARLPQPQSAPGSISDGLGQWTGLIVFGAVSLVLGAVSLQSIEGQKLQMLAVFVSAIPAVLGGCATFLYKKEAYAETAAWLTKAGIATVAAITLVGLIVYAEVKLHDTESKVKEVITFK